MDDLFAMKRVNGVKLDNFFNSVVMKHEATRIPGYKIFINKVVY